MYEYITGRLAEVAPAYAVVEAGGIGYFINISLQTYSEIENSENTTLYLHYIVREDAHILYGFATKAERELFRLLIGVSGVGGNTARMIQSTYSPSELRNIIATGNAKGLAQVKGLGPKTAQRIIVDLKDKVIKLDLGANPTELPMDFVDTTPDSAIKQEAISALTMLGFAAAASGKVVDKILKAEPTLSVELVIKQALKML